LNINVDIEWEDFSNWHKKKYNWRPSEGIMLAIQVYQEERNINKGGQRRKKGRGK